MKKIKRLIILSVLTIGLVGCGEKNSKLPLQSETSFLMDTVAQIDIYDSKDKEIMKKTFDRVNEVENIMSKTISKSDISKINKNAGKELIEVSDETFKLLNRSIEFAKITEGAFDPTIGSLVELWKINDDDNRDWIPTDDDIQRAKALVDYEKLDLNNNKVFLKEKNMKVDLGGIAKGYGADEAKKVLLENGVKSGIIDLGGNIYALGSKTNGEPWNIGIKTPDTFENSYVGILSVRDKSVVTSGGYERYFKYNGEIYHHIIDPKTGYPANSDLKSVTIISDSSADGDAFATSFFVMGLEKTMKALPRFKNIDVILIDNDNNVHISKGIEDIFVLKDENYKLDIID